MKKYKVIKEFKDKVTKEIRKPGDEINVSVKRAKEIMSAGSFIEEVAPVQQEESDEAE